MLIFLYHFSKKRSSWILLALSIIIFEATALYFQHYLQLAPCVLCIYERCAMLGILGAALIALIAPETKLRYLAIILWLSSAGYGLKLTYEHTIIQWYPSPFTPCDLFVTFPSWLPLNKWLPALFDAYGDCADIQWSFLNVGMVQWLLVIFASYLLVGGLVTISQFINKK